jgi:hypothetical protein
MSVSDAAKARAEATFKRKEAQARDGVTAWAEYEAKSRAVAKNMERLRALRLAQEAAKFEATKDPARSVHSKSRTTSTPRQKVTLD